MSTVQGGVIVVNVPHTRLVLVLRVTLDILVIRHRDEDHVYNLKVRDVCHTSRFRVALSL